MNLDTNNNAAQPLQPIEDIFGIESDDGVIGLVPYSFHSDTNCSCDMPNKNNKRKKRVQVKNDAWFQAKNKKEENAAKVIGVDERKVLHGPRNMKPRCKCSQRKKTASLKCSLITDVQRKEIFSNFWKMDWHQKKIYINTLVNAIQPKRLHNRTNPTESKRTRSLQYHLKCNNETVRVCRTLFINTLNIGKRSVLTWVEKPLVANQNTTGTVRVTCTKKKKLNSFFDCLPLMESHYCRSVTQKKYILPEWRSKKMVFDFYANDWCSTNNVQPVSQSLFFSEFEKRNIGLFAPKKDQCEVCVRFSVGSLSNQEYTCHQERKNEARLEKNKDECEQPYVFKVDLQAVLMAPKSQVSSLYYKTKLQVHNLVFYNLINNKGYCFLWNEAEGGVSAEEFASIWSYFIEKKSFRPLM